MGRIRNLKKPYQLKRKKSIFKKKSFWFVVLVLITSGSLFYLIVFSPFFQVREIKVKGGQNFLIQPLVQNQIKQRILFFYTTSIFWINLNRIEQNILEQFPQIAEAEIKRRGFNTLQIKITERKPVAIFYQDQNYFFIDKQGIIFKQVVVEDESKMLKIENLFYQEKLKKGLEIGGIAVKEEIMTKILELENKLEENLKILLERAFIISDERLNVKTDEGWEIYFNLKDNLSQQIFNLTMVLEKEIPLDKREKLEYIDLRFGNEVFYKYR